MADFIPLDPYSYVRGADMWSQVDHRDALTDQYKLSALARRDQMARQAQFDREAAQVEAPSPGRLPIPGQDYPDAGVESGAVPTLKAEPTPLWKIQQGQAERENQLAAIARKAGVPSDKYTDNATKLLADSRLSKADEIKQQQEQLDQAAQLLGTVRDPFSFEVAKGVVNRKGGPGTWERMGMPSSFSPDAVEAASQAARATMKVKEQIDAEQKAAALKETIRKNDADILNKEQDNIRDDKRVSMERERLHLTREEQKLRREEREEQREARQTERDDKHTEEIVKDVQNRLDKNPVIKDYDKYENGRTLATNIEAELKKPGNPYTKTLTGPMTTSLKDSFTQMSGGWRARGATNLENKQVAKFNGAMQTAEKWFGSLGQGTPPLSRDAAEKVIAAMKEMSDIAAATAFVDEFRAADQAQARDRTGRAAGLVSKGFKAYNMETLARLANSGEAVIKDWYPVEAGTKWPKTIIINGQTLKLAPPGGGR